MILTDSELKIPPQVRSFFLVSCIFHSEANSVLNWVGHKILSLFPGTQHSVKQK